MIENINIASIEDKKVCYTYAICVDKYNKIIYFVVNKTTK